VKQWNPHGCGAGNAAGHSRAVADDHLKGATAVAIERRAEPPPVGELSLDEVPVVRRVGVTVVAEHRGEAVLTEEVEEPAQRSNLHGRTDRHGDDVRDARITFAPLQRAHQPPSATRAASVTARATAGAGAYVPSSV